jgi:hypothetical protein
VNLACGYLVAAEIPVPLFTYPLVPTTELAVHALNLQNVFLRALESLARSTQGATLVLVRVCAIMVVTIDIGRVESMLIANSTLVRRATPLLNGACEQIRHITTSILAQNQSSCLLQHVAKWRFVFVASRVLITASVQVGFVAFPAEAFLEFSIPFQIVS